MLERAHGPQQTRHIQRVTQLHLIDAIGPFFRGHEARTINWSKIPWHLVPADDGAWWANCAWDSLAMLAALHRDGRIESSWADTGEPVELTVTDGRLDPSDGGILFPLPARQWWDDIVLT